MIVRETKNPEILEVEETIEIDGQSKKLIRFVPKSLDNSDYQNIMKQLSNGVKIEKAPASTSPEISTELMEKQAKDRRKSEFLDLLEEDPEFKAAIKRALK